MRARTIEIPRGNLICQRGNLICQRCSGHRHEDVALIIESKSVFKKYSAQIFLRVDPIVIYPRSKMPTAARINLPVRIESKL